MTLCKDPNTTWPLQKRPFNLVLRDDSAVTIQVRNTTFEDQNVFAGFFGWYYEDVDASEQGDKTGLSIAQLGKG